MRSPHRTRRRPPSGNKRVEVVDAWAARGYLCSGPGNILWRQMTWPQGQRRRPGRDGVDVRGRAPGQQKAGRRTSLTRRGTTGALSVPTAAYWASFTRCRLAVGLRSRASARISSRRQTPTLPDLDRAVRDALAVYYFPGMWDWDRTVRLPLVGQELERALTRQRQRQRERQQQQRGAADSSANDENWQEALGRRPSPAGPATSPGHPTSDRFAPVLVETDFEVDVLDPVSGRRGPGHQRRRHHQVQRSGRHAGRRRARRLLDRAPPRGRRGLAAHRTTRRRRREPGRVLGLGALLPRDGHRRHHLHNELRSSSTPEREPEQPAPPPPPEGRPRRWPWPRPPRTAVALRAVRQHEPSGARPLLSPAPSDVRPGPGAQSSSSRSSSTPRTDSAAPCLRRSPADVAEACSARRRRGRHDPRGPRCLPRTLRRQVPALPLPRSPCQALMNGTDAEPTSSWRATASASQNPRRKDASADAPGAWAAAPPRRSSLAIPGPDDRTPPARDIRVSGGNSPTSGGGHEH